MPVTIRDKQPLFSRQCFSPIGSGVKLTTDTCTDFWCPHKDDAPYPRARAHYPATSVHTSFFPFASPGKDVHLLGLSLEEHLTHPRAQEHLWTCEGN